MYEWMQKHDMNGPAVSEGLHHTSREFRDRWMSGRGKRNTRGDEKSLEVDECTETGEEDEEASQSDEAASLVDSDGRNALVLSERKKKKRAAMENLFWVPYVHYGI